MWWFSKKLLPRPTGPHAPGCIDLVLDYSIKGLFVTFFYPAECADYDKVDAKSWLKWVPNDFYVSGMAKVMRVFEFIIRLVLVWYYRVDTFYIPVLYGEKMKTDGKLKCIIYSHGMGGFRLLSSYLCYEMASRGFLVVAIEHKDRSACSTYYYQTQNNAKNDMKTTIDYKNVLFTQVQLEECKRMVNYRAEEVCRTLDLLKQLNKGIVPHNVLDDVPSQRTINFKFEDLKGRLDVDDVIVSGHSFGGATSLLAMSKRAEFKQGLLYDPWMYAIKDEHLHEKIERPLIFVNTWTFHNKANVAAMSKFVDKKDVEMYTIIDSDHSLHTDFVFIFGSWDLLRRKINPKLGTKLNNCLVLKFLNKHIGLPKDIAECDAFLSEHKHCYDVGLTTPWV